ncbi:phosphoglycerate kinase [Thermocladium modestius]|uniref:Phosphoglycerate kinase n=1 Tax=Thermocladium modestius TaxID=62609 RepID=A0A830GRZ2_9CREN|nr:phosphoglycerate kinase [Thermocladium modestius]GGP19874.1 phosphoglycerate kinase [Thermocladium modestius]
MQVGVPFQSFRECIDPNLKVLVRIDINVPINVKEGVILDDYRIEAHAATISKLAKSGMSVVVIAHQGRPGDDEFTSLGIHWRYLEKYAGMRVSFIEDVMGPAAQGAIRNLGPGEVLLLDNVRFVSEEVIERSPQLQSNTFLVRRLAPLFDVFVMDAFATAHRSQPSIVGFPLVLPSCAGLVLEKELNAMNVFSSSRRESIVLAGGAKVPDTIKAISKLLANEAAGKILVGGLVGVIFIAAKYGANGWLRKYLEESGFGGLVNDARLLLDKYGDSVAVPTDVGVEVHGDRVDVDARKIDAPVMDIGPATMDAYSSYVRGAEVAVLTGPMGVTEKKQFAEGTEAVFKAMVDDAKFTIIGGGHTIMSARKLGYIEKIKHVSTGGRAFLQFLVGEELPALQALAESKRRFWK